MSEHPLSDPGGSRVLGLIGRAGSGKDTFAAHLVAQHGYVRVAFADPLRELCLSINPTIRDGYRLRDVVEAYGWDRAKRERPEVRRIFQNVGVGVREHVGKHVWVSLAMRGIAEARGAGSPVVITDVRFPNEVTTIRNIGGELVRINRLTAYYTADTHISETGLDGVAVDHVVWNDRDVYYLQWLANKIVTHGK